MKIDYNYLCQGLGRLTGLETRVYKNTERIDRYSPYNFDPDIADLIRCKLEKNKENTFYVETDSLLVFGIIKSKKDKTMLIVGPTSQIRPGNQEMIEILHMLDEPYSRLPDLQSYFANMVPYPFEIFLEILCFVNYALNDEKLSVAYVIKESNQLTSIVPGRLFDNVDMEYIEPHNTFQTEQLMLSYVTAGNTAAVDSFLHSPPTGRVGSIAHNELRQRKNTFICAATLISRAAIAEEWHRISHLRSATDIFKKPNC